MPNRGTSPSAVTQRIRLRIEGMTCGGCVARVERALQAVPGVREARVNLATETATVQISDGQVSREALVEAVRHAGYDAEVFRPGDARLTDVEKTSAARLQQQKQATWQAIAVAIPVMGIHWLAPLIQSQEHGGHVWPMAVQALLCLFLLGSSAGAVILAGGLQAIRHGSTNMDLLISLGVSVAFVAGVANLLTGAPDSGEFDAVATILAFINVGRLLEMRARHQAGSATAALSRRMPATAQVVTRDGLVTLPLEEVDAGDLVRVASDTVVPIDGEVVEGSAAVDESAITGEPLPKSRQVGDQVLSGSVVAEGILTIRAERVGAESVMGRILRAVEEAQTGKTRIQRIADQIAGVFVPIVIVLAVLTYVLVRYSGDDDVGTALRRAVAVLIIACPCAMGLATPTALLVASGFAAQKGILVREAAVLEAAANTRVVLFDKTGTLTSGAASVEGVIALSSHQGPPGAGMAEDEVLQIAACAEMLSQHPLAKAIVRTAEERRLAIHAPVDFESITGRGVHARIDGKSVLVGSPTLLVERLGPLPDLEEAVRTKDLRARTVVAVAVEQRPVGLIIMRDRPRESAPPAVEALRHMGLEVHMITGDLRQSAEAVAKEVGIDSVFAEQLPQQKLEMVKRLQGQKDHVAFVGDGVNDGPALMAAEVGISFGNPTDVALGAAGIAVLHEDLMRIPLLIRLARRSRRIIKQNFFWAFFYNFAAIPLAAGGKISPGIAAACMMFSSLSVVLNSLRIRNLGSQE